MDLEEISYVTLFLLIWHQNIMLQLANNQRKTRRWWVRPVNRRKRQQGFLNNLFREIRSTDHEEFFTYTRLYPEQYRTLLELVTPYLTKCSIRKPLSPDTRLAITLTYLAQGDSVVTKHLEYRVGRSTVYKIIPKVCHAIWLALQPIVLPVLNAEKWKKISEEFFLKWQFPNCVGALDGRHMQIQAPPCSGSQFYNYKGYFSIVLMALCDANYKFTWVDIGQYGSISDGGVWSQTNLAADLESNAADLPESTPLPERDIPFPHVIVADEAFLLKPYLMRPFPRRVKRMTDEERIFNYRLSRARLCIENTFGILASRWRILHRNLSCSVENAEHIFKALVCLHNFAMSTNNNGRYCQPEHLYVETDEGRSFEDRWHGIGVGEYFKQLSRVGPNRAGALSLGLRNYLKEYFVSPTGNAQAPWQFDRAFKESYINLIA
ncbi:putative nuclease HARBI1 [Temnothorax longispinosus]|uniref:putative nuclease HARBI1 n=1 Tax=Temnothorax longispinosus TaxID=300112 RepID=UPI003A98EBBA